MSFATIPELLEEIRAGRMVVIVDDEDRENEGDLIMAAELVRPSDINFMVTHARGLVCLSLTRERVRQLGLPPMVRDNTSPHHTNFTVSIEAAEGVTTGISAAERGASRGNTVRLSVSGRNLGEKKVQHDFLRAIGKAIKAGAVPASYEVFAKCETV